MVRFAARKYLMIVAGVAALSAVCAGSLPNRSAEGNTPTASPSFESQDLSFKVISDVPARQKLIALTFDDGPDPRFTPQVLTQLDRWQARATFFVLGMQAERQPDLVRRIVQHGHQLGNHGYDHRDLRSLTPGEILMQVNRTEVVINRLTDTTTHVFRPPFGAYDPSMVGLVGQRGYRFVLWTTATNSNDVLMRRSADEIARRIITGVRPGAIVLLHDHGGDRGPTVAAVGKVLERLTAQGYRFVTLDELFYGGDKR